MVTNMKMDKGQPMASSLLVTMKCRPKEPVRLNCRFENARITKFVPEKFEPEASVPPVNATFSDLEFGNASFEIFFKEDGIESYTFENDKRLMGDYEVNMYRLIANHLSVGIKFRKDVPSRLRKVENSTLGECSVNYNVSRTKLEQQASNKDYQLVWLADQKIDPEQATEISKQTDLNNCTPHWVYYFGTRHSFGIVPVASKEKLVRIQIRFEYRQNDIQFQFLLDENFRLILIAFQFAYFPNFHFAIQLLDVLDWPHIHHKLKLHFGKRQQS